MMTVRSLVLTSGGSAAASSLFIATVQQGRSFAGPVNDLHGIAPAIAACWHPPHEGDAVTLRLSFRRDGSVIGRPRITYSQASGGDGGADLANSIFTALADCTPLPLTPQLGAAIAGRVFLIRFVAPRKGEGLTTPSRTKSQRVRDRLRATHLVWSASSRPRPVPVWPGPRVGESPTRLSPPPERCSAATRRACQTALNLALTHMWNGQLARCFLAV